MEGQATRADQDQTILSSQTAIPLGAMTKPLSPWER